MFAIASAVSVLCGVGVLQADETLQSLDRPLILSVNPIGNGDFVGARGGDSDFTRYGELVWQKVSEAGSRSARVLASWRDVEAKQGEWDWSNLDREMALCEKYGIEPVVLITNIPAWVSPTGKPSHDHPPKEENAEDFTTFITKMAERYKGKAHYYEFWNEQNGCMWINEGCKNAHMAHTYLPWMQRCYRAIKSVDPKAQVGIGGLDDADGHAPLWLEQAYQVRKEQYGGEKMWDAITDHPYSKRAENPVANMIAKLDALRKIAAKYGDENIPVWITEYGWDANETSIEHQQEATKAFLERAMKPDQKDLAIAQQLALADFEPVHLGYGLCDLNLRPRPAFGEFQRIARHDVCTPLQLRYRLQTDGELRLTGYLMPASGTEDPPTFAEIHNEQGKQLGSQQIRTPQVNTGFNDLPRDVPLLLSIRSELDGKRQPPVMRMPILVPSALPANGDFESLFRAGVPWGWRTEGQAIARDGGTVSEAHRHGGSKSLMLMLFDNAPVREFDDKVTIPIPAARDARFKARLMARYDSQHEADALMMLSMSLENPQLRKRARPAGVQIHRDWTEVSVELKAPDNNPDLVIQVVSEKLPKAHWLICIDDVSLNPVANDPPPCDGCEDSVHTPKNAKP